VGDRVTTELTDEYGLDFDLQVLARLLFMFNIARHHVGTYPDEHPLTARSIQNFLLKLDELLEFSDEVTIGIARDTLMVGNSTLEKNAVFSDLAQNLFDCDIAVLSIRRSVTHHDLCTFFRLLGETTADIRATGGFSQRLRERGVTGLSVIDINYSSFHATEMDVIEAAESEEELESRELPWDGFISALTAGQLDPDGEEFTVQSLDPSLLANLLNQKKLDPAEDESKEKSTEAESYDSTITSFFKQLDREDIDSRTREDSLRKMSLFIDRLNPELRKQLLNSTFATLGGHKNLTETVVSGLSAETLMDIVEDVSNDKIEIPPGLFNLVSHLARTKTSGDGPARVIQKHDGVSDDLLDERIRTIFQSAGTPGDFIPETYQSFLEDVLNTEKLDILPQETIDEMTAGLSGHSVETSIMEVVLEVIDAEPMSEQSDLLTLNLTDLVRYFAEVGDFVSLITVYDRLQRHREESEAFSIPIAEQTLLLYSEAEFVAAVIAGFEAWGPEKHDEISRLIKHVSGPFVDPLINRIADEENMAMRQFLMSLLFEIGEPAKQAAIRHLQDKRWYLVRNLVILLRRFNDPEVMPPLRFLIGHSHPKVHLEALKTYQHFKDPKADRYLLRELKNAQQQRQLNAAFLARNSRSAEVHQALLTLLVELEKTGKDPEYKLRSLIVKSLAEIGDPGFLPVLHEALKGRNLLRPAIFTEYKTLIVQSLSRYPAQAVQPILNALATESKGELVGFARSVLARLKGKGI
jgi:hypothetical protein